MHWLEFVGAVTQMHDDRQSASVEHASRSVVAVEPPDARVDPPVPAIPPVDRTPPTPLLLEWGSEPPLPVGVATPMAPPFPGEPPLARAPASPPPAPPNRDEPPSGACNPMGVREQAKTMQTSIARRFISSSLPQDTRAPMQATTIRAVAGSYPGRLGQKRVAAHGGAPNCVTGHPMPLTCSGSPRGIL